MIILLTGSNDFGLRQACDALVAEALNKHGMHAIERIDGESFDPSRLPDLLQGTSLFASERLVMLREPSKNKSLWEAIGDFLEKVSSEVTFVIIDSSPDKRTRTYKQLQKHGAVREFPELNEVELAKWAVTTAKAEGATLDSRTATYLVRQAGADQWKLWSELQKLIAADPAITKETIDRLIEPSPQASVFDLLDSALQGNTSRAMELLGKLKASEDPYKLFGLLVSQVHTLAVVVTAQGKSPDMVAKEASIHPFVVRKMQPLARSLNYTQLQGIISSVAKADMQMKSTGADPWTLLEQSLGKIATRLS
jgi:DNA polymerase-3 subunit delta